MSKRRFHFSKRFVNKLKSLALRVNHFRIRLGGSDPFHPLSIVRGAAFRSGAHPGKFLFSANHQSSVHHNAREPGRKGRSALETGQVEISGKNCVLDCVFRVFSTSPRNQLYVLFSTARRNAGRCAERWESYSSLEI